MNRRISPVPTANEPAWPRLSGVRVNPIGVLLLTLSLSSAAYAQAITDISVNGQPLASLEAAVAAAVPGDTILLGPGLITLSAPVVLPAGVSIEGASARETLIDANGSAAGIQIQADLVGFPATVRNLEISGAGRGIEVSGGQGVVIRNVVLRDNQESGLYVAEGAEVTLLSATLAKNPTGVVAVGITRVRNSILMEGDHGLVSTPAQTLTSSYNDMFEISVPYDHVQRGIGDMAFAVTFQGRDVNDFRLTDNQVVTDRGDPLDQFSDEPAPNGGRVNLGAFGNTADAELSLAGSDTDSGGCAFGGPRPLDGSEQGEGDALIACFVLVILAVGYATTRRRRV